MTRFTRTLRQINEELDLPQPTRSRILLEMAGDLEDLYQHHLSQGLDPDTATRRAEEAFAASDEALKHLARIHRSGAGLADRLARQVGSPWEKALLVAWALAFIFIAGQVTTQEGFFVIVSPFVWPIGGLALAGFAFTLWKVYELVLKRPPDLHRLRSGLGVLLFLAAASLAISVCGFFYHLRWYAYQTYEGAPETVFMMFATWTRAISSMMVIGLLTAVLTAVVWFLLTGLVTRIEGRRADALLAT